MHTCGKPSANWLPHLEFDKTNLPRAMLTHSQSIPCLKKDTFFINYQNCVHNQHLPPITLFGFLHLLFMLQ